MKNQFLLFISFLLFIQFGFGQSKLYFSDKGNGVIYTANTDGSDVTDRLRQNFPTDLVHDYDNGKIYFTDEDLGTLNVLTLDGRLTVLTKDLKSPTGLQLDKSNDILYVVERNAGAIISLSINGTERKEIISDLDDPNFVFFSQNEGKLYWTDYTAEAIYSVNLDGSDKTKIIDDAFRSRQLYIDVDGGYAYWVQSCSLSTCGGIWRKSITGGEKEQLTEDSAGGLGFDPVNKKIYWGEPVWNNLHRSNLDGSGEEVIKHRESFSHPASISLAIEQGVLFYIDYDKADLIHQIDIDGQNRKVIYSNQIYAPTGIYVDGVNQKLYWTNSERSDRTDEDALMTADLDGTNITPLNETLGLLDRPIDITIDHVHQKMYWTDQIKRKIYRADLDGKNSEAIIEENNVKASGLCVDPSRSKIYWVDPIAHKLQKANLDGTDVEDLFDSDDGLSFPSFITIDTINQRLYWTESSKGIIKSSNTDGSEIQIVHDPMSGFESIKGIYYDYDSGNLYFVNSSQGHVVKFDSSQKSITEFITISERFNSLSDVHLLVLEEEEIEEEKEVLVEVQEVKGPWDFIIMSVKEEDIISLEVTDEVGNVISTREVNKKVASYNANDLPPGNYLLEITTEIGKMTKRITID